MRMRLTVLEMPPTVTVSPDGMGRSNKIIKPETKLAKISCKPKPKPTVTAATNHWTFDQPMPMARKAKTRPNTVIAITRDGSADGIAAVRHRTAIVAEG